eukprot:sb/3473623/
MKKEEVEITPPDMEIIHDFVHQDVPRQRLCRREESDLDLPEESDLQLTLETLLPLPDIDGIEEDDEMETGYLHDETISSPSHPPSLDVNISRMSDLDTTRLQLDSLRIFDESIRSLEYTLDDLELPSTPDLDHELSELLELSFDVNTL